MRTWKKLKSKVVHKNPWYSLDEDEVVRPDGSKAKYYVLRKDPGVVIVAFDGKKVCLVNQYRYTLGGRYWELPAGKTEKENALATAKRELKEETGMVAKKWRKLGKFAWAPGFSSQIGYAYLALDLKQSDTEREGSEADMKSRSFSIKEVDEMIKRGKIIDGGTIAPWYLFKEYLKQL